MIQQTGLDKILFLGNPGIRARGSRSAGPTTLILDQFTDTNGTAIASHTIAPTNVPATSWTAQVGTWQIQTNRAQNIGGAANGHFTSDAGVANCTISGDVTCPDQSTGVNQDTGLVARWSDASNYWRVGINEQDDLFRIVERATASNTSRASTSVTFGIGSTGAISAVFSAQSITATVNGANQITYGSAALNESATVHGVFGSVALSACDNFTVIA